MFWTCPRSWYMKYIQDVPKVENLVYAYRGTVVHDCMEEYYPEKNKSKQEIRELFEEEWDEYDLDDSKLRNAKDDTWKMVERGMELDLPATSTELKIYYPDVVSYLDLVDSQNKVITDWKTSTRREDNEKKYLMQLKYYSWLYYRKFDELPNKAQVVYLKYDNEYTIMSCKPTMQDIKNAREWHEKTKEKMRYYINNPEKLPPFNKDYYFSPYKYLWNTEKDVDYNTFNWVLLIRDNYFYIKGEMDEFLKKHFCKKFSYELKDAYFIKKNKPNADTTVKFFHRKQKRLPIGFLQSAKKTLRDYAEYKDKECVIKVNDNRKFCEKNIDMPSELLSDKKLRDYQLKAVKKSIKKKMGVLEIGTGGGKTLIACEIIRRLGYKTLFVVDKKELLYQAKDVFENNLNIDVGVIGDGKDDIKDVNVATIQTLRNNFKKYKDFLNSIRIFIADESHKVASDSYQRLAYHLKNTEYRFGLTGTNYRDDGNDMKIDAILGDNVFTMSSKELVDNEYLVNPDIYFIDNFNTSDEIEYMKQESKKGLINETDNYNLYYDSFIVNNEGRNKLIKKICERDKQEKVLVLVKRINHGEKLKEMIDDSEYICGETDSEKRTEILDKFKNGNLNIVIGTITIFSEGVDIPSLNVVVNAAANKGNVKSVQSLGRVLRKKKGKDKGKYFDFIDNGRFFKNASYSRKKVFTNEGYNVKIKDKNWMNE